MWNSPSLATAVRFNFLDKVHGVDSSAFRAFGMFLDTEGVSAMRHQNSVLHQILKLIPWAEFERLVEAHKADKHVRRLTTKGQLVAMLYAQLAQAESLRAIEAGLQSHSARLYHSGAARVKRSTL